MNYTSRQIEDLDRRELGGNKLSSKRASPHKYLPLPSATAWVPRVVLLVQDLSFGGSQRQAIDLAGRMDRKRFRVEIWALMTGEDLLPLAKRYKVPVRWIARRTTVQLRSLWRLWRALKAERPEVLVPFTTVPNIWGRLLGRLAGVPRIVATVRGGGAPYRQHERLLWRFADHHICNAMNLKEILVMNYGVPATRITVVHNGVDVELYRPKNGLETKTTARPSSRPPIVVCVARLVPDKDHATLLAAFAKVVAELPETRLMLVGDGPLEEKLKRQAVKLDIAAQVDFVPGQLDVTPFLTAVDCFVLSSTREGFPNVILEAMAAGLPVVATAVGGVPELVIHEGTGLLAKSKDVTGLAAALTRLLSDANLRERCGQSARTTVVKHFSLEIMARVHEALFESLLVT